MIDTIGGKVVMVSNQASALEFYVNKLGLQKKVDMQFGPMRWLEVAPPNSESTISLMQPNPQIMPPEVADAAKRSRYTNRIVVLHKRHSRNFCRTQSKRCEYLPTTKTRMGWDDEYY